MNENSALNAPKNSKMFLGNNSKANKAKAHRINHHSSRYT
jgi:hypothetical protein